MTLDNLHIVLVRPAEPMNIGAVARAMKNCDLSRLTLVAPRTEDWVTARRIAVHAEDLLASPRVVTTLAEAVANAQWVVGTTSRSIAGRPPLEPRAVAIEAAPRLTAGEVALAFGGEESGLSNDDLACCHAVSTIPAGTAQPSFNLAQAVMLYGYEVMLATRSTQPRAEPVPRARDGEIGALEAGIREVLRLSGFADPDRPRHGVRELVQPLRRAGLLPAEARLWRAAVEAVMRTLKRPGGGGTGP